jgi:hypothetical protein
LLSLDAGQLGLRLFQKVVSEVLPYDVGAVDLAKQVGHVSGHNEEFQRRGDNHLSPKIRIQVLICQC